jgi:hypothetical protein
VTAAALDEFRCRRDRWCSAKEPVRDPVAGFHVGWVGAVTEDADGLCVRCVGQVEAALIALPMDVAEITKEIGKPLGGAKEEQTAHPKPGPTLPIQEDREALRALIDHEACAWARAVAFAAGVPWSRYSEEHSRLGSRVEVACALLRYRLTTFLSLGPYEYRARSLGVRRTDGHDEEVVTRFGDDYWTTRDGVEGALLLVRLHERAETMARQHAAPMPVFARCPSCREFGLRRTPGEEHATCQTCGHQAPVEHLDVLREAARRCNTPRDVATLAKVLKWRPPPAEAAQ